MPGYNSKYKNKKQQTLLEVLIVGIFKGIWMLLKLPFGGLKKRGLSTSERQEILTRRLEIESMVSDDINSLKQAVFEADKLVDYALKTAGYGGETFADRLRNAESNISSGLYNKIWQGHKVRNQIAHEHNFQASTSELKQAVYNLLEYIKSI